MPLKKKLIILFIAFTLIPLVLFGAVVFSQARNILQRVRIAQLNNIADLKKDKIETFFNERRYDIRSAQNFLIIRRTLPALSRHMNGRTGPAYVKYKKELDGQMSVFQQAYDYLDVMLTDVNGRVAYVTSAGHAAAQLGRPLPDRKAFEEGKKGIYFTNVFVDKTPGNRFELLGLAPVNGLDGKFIGEVVFEIDMDPIYAFIQNATGLGDTGEGLIVKKEGGATLFLSPLRNDRDAALKKRVFSQDMAARKAAEGENGSGVAYDYQGREVLAAWRYIPFLRWGLVTKMDAAEAFAPVRQLTTIVTSIGIFMVLGAVLAAMAIARTISRPILSLQQGAEAIAAGDASHRVGTDAQDEVGRLSRAFDAMTDAVDRRVQERTKELETAIAERKEAEKILELANAYNRSLLEASLDLLVTIDADGKITDVNAATEKVTGRSREELVGTDFSDYFTDPEKAGAGYRQVFREGSVKDYALEIRHRDGRTTPVLYNATVYRDEAGRVIGVFAAARDITDLRETERRITLANAYNRSLLEASLDPLVTIDADGKITDVNAATEKVTGRPRDELVGTDFSDYFTDPEKAGAGYRQVFREGSVKDYALEIRHRDGRITPVLYNATVYRDEAGRVIGVFAAARDITDLRETERRVTLTNELLKLYTRKFSRKEYLDVAVDLIRDWSGCHHTGVRIADSNGNIPYESCVGYNMDFLCSENTLSVKHDHCVCTRVVTGVPESSELVAMTPNGSFYSNHTLRFIDGLTGEQRARYRGVCMRYGFTSLAVIPIRHGDDILGAIHVADEREGMVPLKNVEFIEQLALIIGEALFRFGIEEELRQLNKELEQRVADRTAQLEAANRELEAFAYSVSHDLRAPLRSMDGFSLALLEDYADKLDDGGKDYLERVRAAASKMGQLIDALLNLSRLTRGEITRATVDLSSLARNMADELRKSEPHRNAEFVIADGVTAKGDPLMLRVVIENLLENAWKFTGKRDGTRIEFGVVRKNGSAFFVKDNGTGFDMNYANKLFMAFQRLHSADEFPGLGIGLATVQRIINRHGGKIWAEGEVGKGATFYFTLG